ncbi:MAG: DUF2341 domain-containing protein [Patescibacteria group bacterium]|nr:DUF2341 domain-containing protein [Patescibacteria group bacterium]MDD5164178.1 DUF2341 domain-containing protein [Patescibacteria group bacterium]MDD5534488.1 DUF2341 domain-containing protein [Patescibacteria group bacterium]
MIFGKKYSPQQDKPKIKLKKILLKIFLLAFVLICIIIIIQIEIFCHWRYRESITIDNTNNSSDLINYQIKIPVAYDLGMQSDFDGIRFTDSDGTSLIDYWLESKIDSTLATFWVEIPDISAYSKKIIYMYYGNLKAKSRSSGPKTFIFFDDFESKNFSRWGVPDDEWSIENSIVKKGLHSGKCTTTEADQPGGYMLTGYTGQKQNIRIQTWARTDNGSVESCSAGFIVFTSHDSHDNTINYSCNLFFGGPNGDGLGSFRHRCQPAGPIAFPNDKKYSYNTWYEAEVILDFKNSVQKTYVDGDDLGDIPLEYNDQTPIATSDNLRSFGPISATSSGTINFYIDDYRISQYTSPEPTVNFGSKNIIKKYLLNHPIPGVWFWGIPKIKNIIWIK